MITLFTTAKPFQGRCAVIQRNALMSWKLLHPDVEVIVFGDDAGAAEVCQQLGLLYEANVDRKEDGTKSLRSIFDRAQQIARHEFLCYSNCDIILTSDFPRALTSLSAWQRQFLMVGCRWDLDVIRPLDFSLPFWQEEIVELAQRDGYQRLYYNIDYFVFPRGLYKNIPDLVIGRNWWDQWLVWRAADVGAPVVDASGVVCAVHQNHDYSYHPQGMFGVWNDSRTLENFRQAGGWSHLHTIEDATYRLTSEGLQPNRVYWLAPAKRRVRNIVKAVRTFLRTQLWHPLLERSRPLRQALGLQRNVLKPLRRRDGPRRHRLDQ